jgi:hypothetical protein
MMIKINEKGKSDLFKKTEVKEFLNEDQFQEFREILNLCPDKNILRESISKSIEDENKRKFILSLIDETNSSIKLTKNDIQLIINEAKRLPLTRKRLADL